MSGRNCGQLHSNEMSALLPVQSSCNNPSAANILLGQHQNMVPSVVSLPALRSEGMLNNVNQPTMSAQAQHYQYDVQTAKVLTALLEQKHREDQNKMALMQQLNNALYAHQPACLNTADNLALILRQRQLALSNQSNATALALLAGVPLLGGESSSADIYCVSNFLQSQRQQLGQIPQMQIPVAISQSTAAVPIAYSNGVLTDSLFMESDARLASTPTRRNNGCTSKFPQKLNQMLLDLEQLDGGTEIASFLDHGRAFAIHKPREFVKQVMPKYFRMSSFTSFQRQLNLYEFQRIKEGPDKGAYYHELFMKGRPNMSNMMRRNKIKGGKNFKHDACRPKIFSEKKDSQDKGTEHVVEEDLSNDEDE